MKHLFAGVFIVIVKGQLLGIVIILHSAPVVVTHWKIPWALSNDDYEKAYKKGFWNSNELNNSVFNDMLQGHQNVYLKQYK